MSAGLALPEAAELAAAAEDPGAFVVAALDRAKAWLQQASTTDLPDLVEAKAQADAIRCYVAQKELGKDAELAAAEIVRRAERRIAELIREGQAEGTIRRRGDGGGDPRFVDPAVKDSRMSPREFLPDSQTAHAAYEMADGVAPDDFEEALEEARDERNLSRANVVRKVRKAKARRADEEREGQPRAVRVEQIRPLAAKGYTSHQIGAELSISADRVRRIAAEAGVRLPADEAIGRVRAIDSNRIVRETTDQLEALVSVLHLVECDGLDEAQVARWAASLRCSLRALQRFTKELMAT